MRLSIVFLLTSAGAACSKPMPEPQYVVLERTPCLGDCPEYRLEIAASGRVIYEGAGYRDGIGYRVNPVKRDSTQLPPAKVAAVFEAFKRAWSPTLPNQVIPGGPRCPR